MKWQGVIPAITTPFKPDFSVDADLLVKQVDAVRGGCTGIVALGSLGEGARSRSTRRKPSSASAARRSPGARRSWPAWPP